MLYQQNKDRYAIHAEFCTRILVDRRCVSTALNDASNRTHQLPDVALGLETRIAFVSTFSSDPSSIPRNTLSSWIGASAQVSPTCAQALFTRAQDVTLFLERAANVPYLIIEGSADPHVTPGQIGRELKSLNQVKTVVIAGAGHALFYDVLEGTVEVILNFTQVNRERARL